MRYSCMYVMGGGNDAFKGEKNILRHRESERKTYHFLGFF